MRSALLLAAALLLGTLPSGAEAKRKKPRKVDEAEEADKAARRKVKKHDRPPRQEPRAEECQDGQRRCDNRVLFSLQDDTGKPLSAFRYRLRIGEQKLEGACPPAVGEVGAVARCAAGALLLPMSPDEVDVVFEASGFRPLLQTLQPAYEAASGCGGPCRQSDVRLQLRRERSREELP